MKTPKNPASGVGCLAHAGLCGAGGCGSDGAGRRGTWRGLWVGARTRCAAAGVCAGCAALYWRGAAFSGWRAMAFGGGREACPCRPGLACLQKIVVLYRGMHLFGPEMTLFARQQRHSGGGVPLFRAGMLHFIAKGFISFMKGLLSLA